MTRKVLSALAFLPILSLVALAPAVLCADQPPKDKQLHGRELRQDDPEIRHYLEVNLPPIYTDPLPPTADEVAMLADLFRHGERKEAERVVWVLGNWKGATGIAVLLEACDSKEPAIAAQAASSLGMQAAAIEGEQKAQAVHKLQAMLDNKDRRVVAASLQSLGALKAGAAAADLGRFAPSEDYELAVAAIRSLGDIGDPANFELVRPHLDADNVHVAVASIEAVGKFGDKSLAAQLVPKLNAENPTQRVAAIRAMAALKPEAQASDLHRLLDDTHGYIRREALSALAEIGGEKYEKEYIASTKDADHTVRQVAVQSIGRFNLVRGAKAAYALFADPHFYVREDAVDTVVILNTDEVRQLCAGGLADKVDTVRECSSQTLGRLRCDLNLDAHIALLKDPYLGARAWAGWALGEIGRKEASPALYECAFPKNEKEDLKKVPVTQYMLYMDARASSILSMGKLAYAEALPIYREKIPMKPVPGYEGYPTDLRKAAVRSIGMLKDKDPKSVNILASRLNDMLGMYPESPDLRFEAAVAFGRMGVEGTVGQLMSHLKMTEETYEIRTISKWAIAQITGKEPDYQIPPRQHPTPDYFVRLVEEEKEPQKQPAQEQPQQPKQQETKPQQEKKPAKPKAK